MTSNIGTRQLKDFGRGVGFDTGTVSEKDVSRSVIQKSLNKAFSPEFLNRIDDIITFDQLDKESIFKIIDIELKGFFDRISALGYRVELTDEAKNFVAEKGYDIQFGARPLKRAIQNYLEDEVAEIILRTENKKAAQSGSIMIPCKKDHCLFTRRINKKQLTICSENKSKCQTHKVWHFFAFLSDRI